MNTRPPILAGAGCGVLRPGAGGRTPPTSPFPAPTRCCFPAVRAARRLYSLAAAVNRPAGLPEEAR
jgi:hypothetical protein